MELKLQQLMHTSIDIIKCTQGQLVCTHTHNAQTCGVCVHVLVHH